MKKIAVLFLIVILAFAVSCGEINGDGESTDNEGLLDTYTANTEILDAENAIPYENVRIVRADKAPDDVVDAAVSIRKAILALGQKTDLITDWTAQTSGIEIIVGDTNRASETGLKLGEFKISRDGNRIFIFGGDAEGLAEGTDFFCRNLLSSEGLLVPDGYLFVKRSESPIEKIIIDGKTVSEVRIFAGTSGVGAAYSISDAIKSRAGMTAEITEVMADADILFTETDASVPEGEWGITAHDEKLFIVARNDTEARKAGQFIVSLADVATGVLSFEGLVHSEMLISEDEALNMKNLVIYPEFPSQMRRIYDYDVSVTMGTVTEKLPVYNHVVESDVSRRPGVDMYRRFSQFAFSGGTVRVDIKVKTDFGSYTVFPSSKNFKHDFNDGVISVFLDEPDYFGIILDDDQNTILSVLADFPEYEAAVPSKNDPSVIWIDGWQKFDGGILTVDKPNTTVYIPAGAVLNARTVIKADNCRIMGRGAIVDPFENIYEYDIREGGTEGTGVRPITLNAKDCTIDGITIVDARCFNITCYGKNNTFRNVKEFSAMMTTDGITTGGSGHLFEHMWLYVGDDAIVCYSSDTVFRDIAIGTTCSAMFPQSDPQNVLFEDINVFRADDGVLHNYFANKAYENDTESITYNGLYALEMPTGLTHFFRGRNRGTGEKIFNFNNVSIASLGDTLLFENGGSYIFTENYKMTFNNLAIGGSVIKDASDIPTKNPDNARNEINVTCDNGYTPALRNQKTVDYTARGKIYIGSRQVFLENGIRRESGRILLPTEQICDLLRTKKQGNADYISTDELISAKVISSASERHGNIYLTPVYTGENLLLPDEGEVSFFAEFPCYQLDLVTSRDTGGIIYTVYGNNAKSVSAGISRRITDEVRMYGEGTYRVTFSAKACRDGKLCFGIENDDEAKKNPFPVTTEWKKCSFDVEISSEELESMKCVFFINGKENVIDSFSLRDFSLVKIE